MKEILLIKMGELILKGLNRSTFENVLIKNIRYSIKKLGKFNIVNSQSTLIIEPFDSIIDFNLLTHEVSKIFGIAKYCRAVQTNKNLNEIKDTAAFYFSNTLKSNLTFKVEAKRSDKKFPYNSPEICKEVGEYILENFDNLSVDVHNPDIILNIEIRDKFAYLHTGSIKGAGGLPVGTGGKAAVLISGGIDSPVAAYMMAKRGVKLTAIHFESPPYTSIKAHRKVVELINILSESCGKIKLISVPFTRIQESVKQYCKEEFFTIIMRRFMMKISTRIAFNDDCLALITGESLGQVASQTLSAINCTDQSSSLPVFRPLIGLDKSEIIEISKKIGAFKTSIEPYEDCCTIFTPKHPRTRPVLKFIEKDEKVLTDAKWNELVTEALNNLKYK